MLADGLDSFFMAVKARILSANPSRQIFGIMDASDWPPKVIDFEAFYCLTQGEIPLGRSMDSAAIPVVSHQVAWIWFILGQDLQAGVVGRNRGARYRTNMQMKSELLYALFPRFTQKLSFSLAPNANPPQLQSTPVTPNGPGSSEYILWQPAKFATRPDKNSGSLMTTATVRITDMTDEIDILGYGQMPYGDGPYGSGASA